MIDLTKLTAEQAAAFEALLKAHNEMMLSTWALTEAMQRATHGEILCPEPPPRVQTVMRRGGAAAQAVYAARERCLQLGIADPDPLPTGDA